MERPYTTSDNVIYPEFKRTPRRTFSSPPPQNDISYLGYLLNIAKGDDEIAADEAWKKIKEWERRVKELVAGYRKKLRCS